MKHLLHRGLLLGLLLVCTCQTSLYSQDYLRLLFYNTENYFDTKNDTLKQDDAFLPEGDYHWTPQRFWHKTHQLAKVLAVAGDVRYPDVFALAEIETEENLTTLLRTAGMRQYRYVYAESQDDRGIDLCLVYHRYYLKLLSHKVIHLQFPQSPSKRSRPILYVKMQMPHQDSLHIFVCHWPSKYGGSAATAPLRAYAGAVLRQHCDSIFALEQHANILIMGDFNDEADDLSLREHLGALPDTCRQWQMNQLYNLMWTDSQNEGIKTHRYQGEWAMLDQIIVSGNLYRKHLKAKVLKADFLLMDDDVYLGKKPYRTYHGYKYLGGYSDHLPVFVDIPLKP